MAIRLAESAAAAYHYPLLIKQLLHTPLATAPLQEIVYRERLRYDYCEFKRRIGRLANVLTTLGVESGTTVAVMDWDSHRYLEAYFAVPMLGAILQTVNVRLSPEQILYTLNDTGAELLLLNLDFLPVFEQMRTGLAAVRQIVLLDDYDSQLPGQSGFAGEYEGLTAAASADFDFPDFNEDAVATTFHSTGTTGKPKAVSFSHRQLVLHTLASICAFASAGDGQCFRQGDVYMPMTPMFHVHAWGIPYMMTLLGLKQVYPGRYDPRHLLALRKKEGVTYSHCVPTILQMLLQAADEQNADLHGWKLTIGGAAFSSGLARSALEHGMNVFAAYGMSETGPILTITRFKSPQGPVDAQDRLAILCKTGLPIPLVDLRVVDAEMRDVPHNGSAQGELVVRAPWLTQGYRGEPALSEELWRGGYLHTQDIASIDAEGYVLIRDRLKDVIKTGGEWLSSLQLEDLISRHPGVAEVAVIGVPDERWGERPVALVVVRLGFESKLTPLDIKQHVEHSAAVGKIPRYAVPEHVEFVTTLAKTSVGKLDKKRLREQFANPHVPRPAAELS